MSHRIKRFAAFAIFARFYLVAAVDSILGFYRHQTDTKTSTATTRSSLPEETVLVSTFPGHRGKRFAPLFGSKWSEPPGTAPGLGIMIGGGETDSQEDPCRRSLRKRLD